MLDMQTPLTRKLSCFAGLTQDDLAPFAALMRRKRRFCAGQALIHEGEKTGAAYVLVQGWCCSYKILRDGERQIVDIQIPGDFMGLRSILFHSSDQSTQALTPIEVCEITAPDMLDSLAQRPRLATAVLWAISRDEAMMAEHLVNLGRRSADVRMAHFLLELGARLRLVGIGDADGFACPLTQYHLADALGLSAVHVNRVLRHLREVGLVTFQKGRVRFDDRAGLRDLAGFDPDYLDHPPPVPDG
jgi:CRP-like cAMP-binding protein